MKMATFKKERPEMTRRSAVGELIDRESGTCRDVFDIPGVLHFLKIIIIIIIIFCVCVCVFNRLFSAVEGTLKRPLRRRRRTFCEENGTENERCRTRNVTPNGRRRPHRSSGRNHQKKAKNKRREKNE